MKEIVQFREESLVLNKFRLVHGVLHLHQEVQINQLLLRLLSILEERVVVEVEVVEVRLVERVDARADRNRSANERKEFRG